LLPAAELLLSLQALLEQQDNLLCFFGRHKNDAPFFQYTQCPLKRFIITFIFFHCTMSTALSHPFGTGTENNECHCCSIFAQKRVCSSQKHKTFYGLKLETKQMYYYYNVQA